MQYNGINKDNALSVVKQHGFALRYLDSADQTEEICLVAVNRVGVALKYANIQTEPVCLTAVKKNKSSLRYIRDRDMRISIANQLGIKIIN